MKSGNKQNMSGDGNQIQVNIPWILPVIILLMAVLFIGDPDLYDLLIEKFRGNQ